MADNIFQVESGYIPPPVSSYDGEFSNLNQRTGKGYQTWNKDGYQKYSGNFFCDNLHGHGEYVQLNGENSYMYQGTFYANNFEGYANVTYFNGDYFEGLFKHNKRFGPGVYTYPDGSQNVGLWYGSQLIKLSTVVNAEWVPKLANSSIAKVKLLKYKKLIPMRKEYDDAAKEILIKLNARPELVAMSDKLYNPNIRNFNSLFFDKKSYDEKFFGEMDCTIDVLNEDSDTTISNSRSSVVSPEPPKQYQADTVKDVLSYLLENVEIVERFPEEKRQPFLTKSVSNARKRFQLGNDAIIIDEILNDFLKELNYILSKPSIHRILIINKNVIQRSILHEQKSDLNLNLKKVTITDLVAWNNGEIYIDMLKHVFVHRKNEDSVCFSIAKLLSGDRRRFHSAGEMEKRCIQFLSYCSSGNENEAMRILKENNLNVDLCDARGNSGVIFASARDMWRVITILCDFGANIDFVNDEGLTALAICLLRYIGIQNNIKDWERAFIPDAVVTNEEEMQIKNWRPHVSLTNVNLLNTISFVESCAMPPEDLITEQYNRAGAALKAMADQDDAENEAVYEELRRIEIGMVFKKFQEPYTHSTDFKQNYLFSVKLPQYKFMKLKSSNKGVSIKDKSSEKCLRSDISSYKSKTRKKEENIAFVRNNKLGVVFKTLSVLLNCGADPNLTLVPLPALHLAIFSNDVLILETLMKANADPDITTQDEGLTALHMLAALPFIDDNLEMFHILLRNGANPNLRTNTYHWMQEKDKILGRREAIGDDLGKTPLQILSMRYDYINNEHIQKDMVNLLLDNGGNIHDTYLGHNALTLAILRGNLKLIMHYLKSGHIDPYKKLGENMGNATTILILKRYANTVSLETCRAIYELFFDHNVNPLVYIDGYGNSIEFMEAEYAMGSESKNSESYRKKQGKTNASRTLSTRVSFNKSSGPKRKLSPGDEIKKCLIECGKRMLQKHIQYEAFRNMKRFMMQLVPLENEVMITLSKFLPTRDLINLTQLLIHRGRLKPTATTFYLTATMLGLSKKYETTTRSKDKKYKSYDINLSPTEIIERLDWSENIPTVYYNMIEPELDTQTEKYKVCFYCLKKIEKDLIVCPLCGLVYFCCQECNKLSIKEWTVHKCNALFYDEQKQIRDYALQHGLEYRRSMLDDKLRELDMILREKYRRLLPDTGDIDGGEINFDKLGSYIFDKILNDSNFKEKMKNGLLGTGLSDLESKLKKEKLLGEKYRPEKKDISNLSLHSSRERIKKGKKESRESFTSKAKRTTSMESTGTKTKGESDRAGRDKSKSTSSGDRPKSKSPVTQKGDRSKSKDSQGISKIETLYRRDKNKGWQSKGDRSSKYAVYRHDVSKGEHTKYMRERYDREQTLFRQYKDKLGARDILDRKLGFAELDKMGKNFFEHFNTLPNKCQFLIERLSSLFPDIDFSTLFWPYVCYVDGQLYYRFLEERPVFLETYSNV
ncbi:ankyrin repeat and mynd domain protein 1 [Holotrichia oblita]|uniref:Ankyrin repeat and mynd domain protein 1 n=1 Tax=Holotrichia oblita TaxID=644536 RepID=A0ACB9SQ07_HOLOL|nr:ankyrin repeat and mynd domain protein 1 [Holotrichia oblita]